MHYYYYHMGTYACTRKNPPLIIGQEVSVLVLTHANFTHLGISSEQETHPDDSTHFIKKKIITPENKIIQNSQ